MLSESLLLLNHILRVHPMDPMDNVTSLILIPSGYNLIHHQHHDLYEKVSFYQYLKKQGYPEQLHLICSNISILQHHLHADMWH